MVTVTADNESGRDVLRATLHELALSTPDPEALAGFYTAALGYEFTTLPGGKDRLGLARDRRLRLVPGPPKMLAYAGYAVTGRDQLARLEARLQAAGVAFEFVRQPGFDGEALKLADPDGNHFLFGVAEAAPPAGASVVAQRPARLQHVVLATTRLERLTDFFMQVVGFELSDRVVDEEGGLRTVFLRCSHEHHSLALFAASEDRLDHHCYEAVEWNLIRDWADHLSEHFIPLKWGPGRHGPGNNLFLFVHDLDGNWVEISAELEHVAPDRPIGDWAHEERTLNSWGMGFLRS